MKSVAKAFHPTDLFFIALAGGLVLLYVLTAGWGFPLDDSWIHQTYGRNLAQNGEWAFILGTPSAASTAPLYTVLLAVGYTLGIPYMLWTHLLGAAALALAGMFAARMAQRLLPEISHARLAAGTTIVGTWHLVWAASSGMETALFSMFTLLLPLLLWREADARSSAVQHVLLRGGVFGIVVALATLTRPEGVLLGGILGLALLIVRPQGTFAHNILWGVGAGVGFLICMSPYLLLNLHITSGLLPNTSAAKQAQYAILVELLPYPQRFANLLLAILIGGQLMLLPGLLVFVGYLLRPATYRHNRWLFLVPVLWAAALIALYAARLPMSSQHGRYVIPALPSIILFGTLGTLLLLRTTKGQMIPRVLSRVVAVTAALLFAYFGMIAGAQTLARDVRIINEEMVTAAYWIRDNLDPDQLLAIHDIGAVGYFAPRPIFDLAGLVTPEVIPIINVEEPLWALMRERGAVYLMAFPDQVPGDDVQDERLCPIYTTGGSASPLAGGANMTIYALTWSGTCPP